MILERLGYQHRIGEAGVQVSRKSLETAMREIWAQTETWTIRGRLLNTTGDAKDLDPLIANIEQVYSQNGGDIILKHDDGSPTAHAIYEIDTIGGVHVKQPPTFSSYQRGEYCSYRTYEVVLEATKPLVNSQSQFIYELKEELKFSGGGPTFVVFEPNVGPPIIQMAKQQTVFRATQSGRIVTLFDRPILPFAIWPSAQIANPIVTESSPMPFGTFGPRRSVMFSMNYTYEFMSITPLLSAPLNPLP